MLTLVDSGRETSSVLPLELLAVPLGEVAVTCQMTGLATVVAGGTSLTELLLVFLLLGDVSEEAEVWVSVSRISASFGWLAICDGFEPAFPERGVTFGSRAIAIVEVTVNLPLGTTLACGCASFDNFITGIQVMWSTTVGTVNMVCST